ncbi:hypothetical protein [Mycolicibacterium iranicum]|uniref:hypothetical protein n=1 Tax=Mycolicibacterium iranicum TaxID=912594 RepID=UPI001056AEF9|nr:hypothetical protein [Mycolicibacterium iranicum]
MCPIQWPADDLELPFGKVDNVLWCSEHVGGHEQVEVVNDSPYLGFVGLGGPPPEDRGGCAWVFERGRVGDDGVSLGVYGSEVDRVPANRGHSARFR